MRRSDLKPRARIRTSNSHAAALLSGTGVGLFKKIKRPACFLCFQALTECGTVGTVGTVMHAYARAGARSISPVSPIVPYVYKFKGFSMFVGGTVCGTEAGRHENNKIMGVYCG